MRTSKYYLFVLDYYLYTYWVILKLKFVISFHFPVSFVLTTRRSSVYKLQVSFELRKIVPNFWGLNTVDIDRDLHGHHCAGVKNVTQYKAVNGETRDHCFKHTWDVSLHHMLYLAIVGSSGDKYIPLKKIRCEINIWVNTYSREEFYIKSLTVTATWVMGKYVKSHRLALLGP